MGPTEPEISGHDGEGRRSETSARIPAPLAAALELLLLFGVVAACFGRILPEFGAVTDDLKKTALQERTHREHPGLISKWQLIIEGAGEGHYKPIQDLISITAFHFAGPDRWARVVMALYLLLHAVSAFLLRCLLRRFGATPHGALFGACLFVVHPMIDEALIAVQFAPNVLGLFFLLTALLAWTGNRVHDEVPGARRVLLASLCLFASAGCNVNFIVTGPILLVLTDLLVFGGPWWPALKGRILRLLGPALAVGAMLGMRRFFYGTLGSKIPGYDGAPPPASLLDFLDFYRLQAFELRPTLHALRNAECDVPGAGMVDFSASFVSREGAIVVAIAGFALVGTVILGGLQRLSGKERTLGFHARLAVFGVGFLGAWILPYVVFLGSISGAYNRYQHPTAAALAILCVATVSAVLALLPRAWASRVRAPFLTLLALPLLSILIATSREASASIVAAHRMVTGLVDYVAEDLADEPEVRRLYLLGYPRVLGRAGFTFQYEANIRDRVLVRLGEDRGPFDTWTFLHEEEELAHFFQSLFRELDLLDQGTPLLPSAVAVYEATHGGNATRRLYSREDLDLDFPPDLPRDEARRRAGYFYVDRELYDAPNIIETLRSESPKDVLSTVEALSELGPYRQLIRAPMVALFTPRPADAFAANACAGLCHPRVRARAMEVAACQDMVWFALSTLADAGADDRLSLACMERMRTATEDPHLRGVTALRAAVQAQDPESVFFGAAGRALTRGLDRGELFAAVLRERRARVLGWEREKQAEALTLMEETLLDYPPPARGATLLILAMARCRIALDREPGKLPAPWDSILKQEQLSVRASRELVPQGSLEFIPTMLDEDGVLCVVKNLSTLHFPGGTGVNSACVRVRAEGYDRRYPLRDEGLPPGTGRMFPLDVTPLRGRRGVEVTLEVLGHVIARAGMESPR